MAYLKEENKKRVQLGCLVVFLLVLFFTVGFDVTISLFSAAELPQEGETVNLYGLKIDQALLAEFVKGGLGMMAFGFVANVLVNFIDGSVKLKLVNWPQRNVTENLLDFANKKGYMDVSDLEERYPNAFSDQFSPDRRAKSWFSEIYNPVRDVSTVLGANKEFLYWREVYVFSLLLSILYSLGFIVSEFAELKFLSLWGLVASLLCSLCLKMAARNASNTLVRNSLSAASGSL